MGRSSGGGGSPYSRRSYYDPKHAYQEAFTIWHKEVISMFDTYGEAINKLTNELNNSFDNINTDVETATIDLMTDLQLKLIELDDLKEETEELKLKKEWLNKIYKELDEILNI